MRRAGILLLSLGFVAISSTARDMVTLRKGWEFHRGDIENANLKSDRSKGWESVSVPHDWAIDQPFDMGNDLQTVQVVQDGETHPTLKTGRTGGLPYMGTGWYRRSIDVKPGKMATLVFDGAMSEAKVWVNGCKVGEWPYGYASFHFDITPYLNPDGNDNVVMVRLENLPFSSRWYPGAGLYRNVHLITTDSLYVPVWGVHVTTPHVKDDFATVRIRTSVNTSSPADGVRVDTEIINPRGISAGRMSDIVAHVDSTGCVEQNIEVSSPALWSPETPCLYTAVTRVYDASGYLCDSVTTRFGIRTIEVIPHRGFYLNGHHRKFKGVCNHHDLGPLGAAVNRNALRHQLEMLKEMGCDAVRTSHNMPDPQLVELCDEMGFMMMIEPFDEWEIAKCRNGYHRFWDEWAERDMVAMLRHYRNNPSVVMWSVGNEVPTQCSEDGAAMAAWLRDICHREDPTRPVTAGMDQVACTLENGFAAAIDVPGLNYRTHKYNEAYDMLPQRVVLGSETASAVSSRGVYKWPVEISGNATYPDHQSNAYEVESCAWANIPEVDFALADDFPWTMGQFVWTGFDYLGEPSPYNTDAWPSHSSLFGIIDLASIPKDRYWLYRSQWRKDDHTLYVAPHWTHPGREGKITPVIAYTDLPEGELWINGVSMGRCRKLSAAEADSAVAAGDSLALIRRYRLVWDDVVYTPGEIRVVAYDDAGRAAMEQTVRTAGTPYALSLSSSQTELTASADADRPLAYITVSVVDRNGNFCPADSRLVEFEVKGQGRFRAAANGDPTSLDPLQEPRMHLFSGRCTAIIEGINADEADNPSGVVTVTAIASGLRKATLNIPVR
ncbi:glycoside hydrolase family 2 TIM barrel-domain containing protein [Muribaculum intestinale]|uniref:glycoside hydrolase family 2 TIM barrel-domain containing protein n=1 Tax=Muribaculum intestinale TaxID=1796646 RepID=UPI000F4922E2|nr:glycoside hydrolase family 2 protein [Muribaculaceae bacterium Isolate-042 (Harlan)]